VRRENGGDSGEVLAAVLVPELEDDRVDLAARDVGILGEADANRDGATVRERHLLLHWFAAERHVLPFSPEAARVETMKGVGPLLRECLERVLAVFPKCADRQRVNGARALRLGVAVAALVAAGLLAASAFGTSRSETSLRTLNHQVLTAVNRLRVAHGLVPLRESPALDRSARQHSLEMGRVGYFAHTSADGTAFWRRIRRFYGSTGNGYWAVGENLLWAAPSVSAGRAMKMWIGSPEHLRNLLTAQWRQIGISAVHVVRAPGVFHGLAVTIITTDFGVRH
jgi:uncharacterized protein YkwD